MTRFRDWLRRDEADRRRYERIKQELARRTWTDLQHYAAAKSAVIEEILARAAHAERFPIAVDGDRSRQGSAAAPRA